jgi:hypothetical protein
MGLAQERRDGTPAAAQLDPIGRKHIFTVSFAVSFQF